MLDAARLAAWIDEQPTYLGDSWLSSLEARKREEAAFHDHDRLDHRDEDPRGAPNRRFYEAASIVSAHITTWLREHAAGRVVLDYACGNGALTRKAAADGAALAVGIDISEVSIRGAAEQAREAGLVGRTRFLQRDCEQTLLPDESFDMCLCLGMLHHIDLAKGFPELARLMRAGGRILCVEALGYNPLIRAYRRLTPQLRTAWEKDHILTYRELDLAKAWFTIENVRFFLLAAPLATLLPAGLPRRVGLTVAHGIDRVLTSVPGLRLWSWMFSFELVKAPTHVA